MKVIPILASAIIFDLDGTLIDSSAIYERVWTRWAQRVGVSADEVLAISHGRRHHEIIEMMTKKIVSQEEGLKIFYEEEAKESDAREIKGAKDFLHQLPPDRWAIVTSSGKALTQKRLADCGFPQPKFLVSGEDVHVGKPDPTGYNLAVSKFDVPSSECWVFEDAHSGVQAAKAAKTNVVVVVGTFDETAFPEDITIHDFTIVRYLGVTAEGKIKLEIEKQ